MTQYSPEVAAAQQVADHIATLLAQTPGYRELDPSTRASLVQDLNRIGQALNADPSKYSRIGDDPYALSLAGPAELARLRQEAARRGRQESALSPDAGIAETRGPRAAATETVAARAGALVDEIDFPGFVASLIHGTFDSLVDASIRQMEAYAGLVSAVAKDVDRFTSENVTNNQVRDWLVERHPSDVELDFTGGRPNLRVHRTENDTVESPVWLEDYGLAGEELTDELIKEQLIPLARRRIGEQRLQMLATMVLMGMNRITVQNGTISAKVRFRATARDRAQVEYAQSTDPGGVGATWGSRGSYGQASMMVSTVGANVQADTELRAELFGEVRINFASETLPLDRFADAAQMMLLQRHTRQTQQSPGTPTQPATISTSPQPVVTTTPVDTAAPSSQQET